MFKFVDDDLPNHDLPKTSSYFNVFSIFYTVKKMLNHDLPNYNLPKCHFNDANVVLTMFPAMTNNRTVKDERRFATEGSTEQPTPAERPAPFRVPTFLANHDFF